MLKIGLIGSGYLIEKHIELLQYQTNYELVGYFNTHQSKTPTISLQHNWFKNNSLDELLKAVDVVYIFNLPEQIRLDLILKSIKLSKHLMLDISNIKTPLEAKQLLALSEEAGVLVQVCNTSYFTPLFKSAQQHIFSPSYIEAITHVHYKNKSSSAIFDLLCDDLSIILTTVSANLKKISTVGVDVAYASPELINILLEFDNGCVANITVNTIAEEDKKTIRFLESNSSLLLDFLENKINLLLHNEILNQTKEKEVKLIKTSEFEQEINAFYNDIYRQKRIVSDLHSTYKMLELISKIAEKLKINFSLSQE